MRARPTDVHAGACDVPTDATAGGVPRLLTIVAVLLAVVLTSASVLRASAAIVTASTANEGNRIRTATLALDTSVSSQLLDVENLAPGDTASTCLEVTFDGPAELATAIRLYVGGMRDPDRLADHLTMRIVEGRAGSRCQDAVEGETVLDGPLAASARRHTDHATGVGDWVPEVDAETRPYLVEVTLPLGTPTGLRGARITDLRLSWEVTA